MTPSPARLRLAPNVNALWAGLLVEELVRQGVGLFVVAPGSRSAPLALAVAGHPTADVLVHVDERGGAYAALGYARATGRPAALVTTSGTAVANALPAVVEAAEDGVPLLLLTADRPPELRDTGANQTIRQPGLFGGYVRWSADVPAPSADVDPALVLTTAAQAVHRSLSPPGPVHLNLMFREPLAPVADGADVTALVAPLEGWLTGGAPYTRYGAPPAAPDDAVVAELAARVEGVARGVVVAGKSDDPALGAAAAHLAAALGWPLLPDLGSGARLGSTSPETIPCADLVLTSDRMKRAPLDAVIHLGGPPTSKRLLTWLGAARPAVWAVARRGPARYDPAHAVTHRIEADPALFAHALAAEVIPPARPTAWLTGWRAVGDAVGAALEDAFSDDALTEPRTARVAAAAIPAGGGLVAAASMPVRDLDAFAAPGGAAVRVAANRGASGIDGTVGTAVGFARGLGAPTLLLIGDLALLHDLNALTLLREGPPVVVVAVNNDGGG
ncbi:MAG TPA: 2-succinyl-5-enolpyruvyl-6-hydroxy-3-cyclohexene-1-carboxylic-acid synthase, partial [Rhodothermales bacterium]|nr:2-succinyl-5-enolpyruvyl-6-hydroxy-3-cyclohexene-1-carboxylic-acid synthase [Rhodothermales bacterium]